MGFNRDRIGPREYNRRPDTIGNERGPDNRLPLIIVAILAFVAPLSRMLLPITEGRLHRIKFLPGAAKPRLANL